MLPVIIRFETTQILGYKSIIVYYLKCEDGDSLVIVRSGNRSGSVSRGDGNECSSEQTCSRRPQFLNNYALIRLICRENS